MNLHDVGYWLWRLALACAGLQWLGCRLVVATTRRVVLITPYLQLPPFPLSFEIARPRFHSVKHAPTRGVACS